SENVDGQDVRAVYTVTKRLVERARRGDGPAFLMVPTYRFMGHHVGDISREYYRPKQEEQTWKTERDPIKLFTDVILTEKITDREGLGTIQYEVKTEIQQP